MSILDLETERLKFRLVTESDHDAFKQQFSDPEVSRFIGGVQNSEQAWRKIAVYVGHYYLKGYSYLAIEEKATGEIAGCVGLWNSEPWPELELGYWLLKDKHGKGYATEAALALKNYALDQLKIDTLVSYIHPENLASIKVAEKLDATQEETIDLLGFGPHLVYRYK